ncbi:MAG: hypothetical protein F6K56_12525 [Moorea sp. SIO3G5]|nr:hypothetical protein [Moorena sp. SIO3G5]
MVLHLYEVYTVSHSYEVHIIFSLLPIASCLLPIASCLFPVPCSLFPCIYSIKLRCPHLNNR